MKPHDYVSDGKGHCATCGEPNPTFHTAYFQSMRGIIPRRAVILTRYHATLDLRKVGL